MFKFPWQNKAVPADTETRSGATVPPYFTRAGLFENAGCYDLSFFALLKYYKQCAPLADSVDTIANDAAEIDPIVWDTKENEPVEDHDVLALLEIPNTTQSYEDFMIELASMFLITQNTFLESVGNVKRPPLSIEMRSPVYSTLLADSVGDLGKILINTTFINDAYKAETVKRRARYYRGNDKEIWPILGFNPEKGSNKFYGTPRIQSLYYEIEQYIASGRHNTALLKNGARPGGVMTAKPEAPLTADQRQYAQDQLDIYYGGPDNTGRVMFAEWFEYKDMIVNNRDMDFKTLREGTRESIYLRFNIPLPMVTTGTMTFSNYETAQVAEYENAVVPLVKYLLKQITLATMYRYHPEDPGRYVITIDETKIGALGAVRTKTIETMSKIGVSKVNELRVAQGLEPLEGEEGEAIMIPANQIPLVDDEANMNDDAEGEELEKQLANAVNAKGESRRR